MSKRRERLESFREVVKRKRPDQPEVPKEPPMTTWELVRMWSLFAAALAVFAGLPILNNRKGRLNAIETRVDNWGTELSLLYTEVEALKRLELSYHGGDFFGGPPRRTDKERNDHNEKLIKSVREEVAPLIKEKLGYKPD